MTTSARRTPPCCFATDIAARGLDFPGVDWVVQLDCPRTTPPTPSGGEDMPGTRRGEALLVHSEDVMSRLLDANRIPVEKIEVESHQSSLHNWQDIRPLAGDRA